MNVVDSSGWLEWFINSGGAAEFAPALSDRAALIVPSIVVYEVHRVIATRFGQDRADPFVHAMLNATVVELNAAVAVKASDCAREYRLATADAIIYATTLTHKATLWTQDAHFKGLPNVEYREKPARRSDPD